MGKISCKLLLQDRGLTVWLALIIYLKVILHELPSSAYGINFYRKINASMLVHMRPRTIAIICVMPTLLSRLAPYVARVATRVRSWPRPPPS